MSLTVKQLKADNSNLREKVDSLRSKLRECDKEERRLTESSCRFQLDAHHLNIHCKALLQALIDCQEVRSRLYDRVSQLEINAMVKQ